MQNPLVSVAAAWLLLVPGDARSGASLRLEVQQAADRASGRLLQLAEAMPSDSYEFQVVPDSPTFAATLGEAIDVRVRACAAVTGSALQLRASRMRAKTDLLAAMKSSIAECDRAFSRLTGASVVQAEPDGPGGPRSRLSSLYGMVAHDSETYGCLSAHLRLKGIEAPDVEGGAGR